MCPFREPKGPGGVPGKPPQHLVSKRGRLSFRPAPPPRTSPCLSPPLGASRVGCGPSPTCGHAAPQRAEERAGGAATRARRGREAQGAWRKVEWTKTGQWCKQKQGKSAELQNWSEMAQQMATTIFNADGGRLEHQEELSKRWRVATRRKTFSGEESRRQMVVTG